MIDIYEDLIWPSSVPTFAARRACHKAFGAVIGQATESRCARIHSSVETLVTGARRSESGMSDREAEGAVGANVDGLTAGDFGVL